MLTYNKLICIILCVCILFTTTACALQRNAQPNVVTPDMSDISQVPESPETDAPTKPIEITETTPPSEETSTLPDESDITASETEITEPQPVTPETDATTVDYTVEPTSGEMYVKDTVNVRKGPGTSYERVGHLDKGEKVTITGIVNNWYRIKFKHSEYFVEASYLQSEKPVIVTTENPNDINEVNRDGTISLNDITDKNYFFNMEKQDVISLPSDIAYAIYKIDGTKFAGENLNKKFFSACTVKAGYCYYVCTLIDENPKLAQKKLTYTKDCYHDGSGTIKNSKYGTEYTIEYLINKCLSISDNVAYEMLYKEFGKDGYNKLIGDNTLTLKGSRLWVDLTAIDLIKVWEKIYYYFESETTGAKILKESCTNTKFNYGTLSIDVEYSHKGGDNTGASSAYNDAGIIWNGDDTYLYVFLTKGEEYKRSVNKLSKWAFDAMT